jgi:hypothetical protein
MKEKYIEFWKHKITNSSKLTFPSTFKTEYKVEPYLSLIKNPTTRRTFTQFRISNHELQIEYGINEEVNKTPATPKQQTIPTESVNQAETPCEKTFSFVKSNLAHLESDFIDFKQTMSKSLEKKNEELKTLQDKLTQRQTNKHATNY